MNLSLILFLIGVLGFVLNRKNIILMLISIEIMLLAITFLILVASFNFDDILGQIYATYIYIHCGGRIGNRIRNTRSVLQIKRKCGNRIQIMYLTIIMLPLLGSVFSGFFGRKIGVTGVPNNNVLVVNNNPPLSLYCHSSKLVSTPYQYQYNYLDE